MVKESPYLIGVVTHLSELIDGHFFSQASVAVGYLHHIGHLVLHLVPNHDGLSVLHLSWVWLDSFARKEVGHLLRHFSQDLLGQGDGVALKLIEWNELHNVSASVPAGPSGIKWVHVSI